jgi:uncharacterized protein
MSLWRAGRIGWCCGLLLAVGCGQAVAQVKIYQATEIVTGNDMRQRPVGFARCLRDVIVKATGNPALAADPRVAALMQHADTSVAYYLYRDRFEGFHHHDDQGTFDRPYDLTVQFDPPKIDSLLKDLGEKPWTVKRPTLIPDVEVKGEDPPYRLVHVLSSDLSTDDPVIADQRRSLEYLTDKYGVYLRIPTAADIAAWGPDGGKAVLTPNYALVRGTLTFRQSDGGWSGQWRLRWQGTDHAWGLKGGSFDNAYENLVTGAVRILSSYGSAPLKY